jgi:protein-S-isoprenylcysteine O-methyltransferase Ste14
MFEILLFIAASLALLWVSWTPLRDWHSHGFYRFFAWEAIVALVLLNLDAWFSEPFSLHQLVSWSLLAVSLVLVVAGVRSLDSRGKPSVARADRFLLGIERTTRLVTEGSYRYIRHPLYSSLLFLAWGVFFKSFSWVTLVLVLVSTIALFATAWAEERENCEFFGSAYRAYMTRTKRFIPFVV